MLYPLGLFPLTVKDRQSSSTRGSRRAVMHTRTEASFLMRNPVRTTAYIVPWFTAPLLVINLILFFGYLFSVNAQANTGYTIKQLEKKISEQTAENKKLMVRTSEVNSIASVQDSVTEDRFVPITARDTVYVQVQQLSKK
jgi:uncharacterized membrane protein affecting hemolysin expression